MIGLSVGVLVRELHADARRAAGLGQLSSKDDGFLNRRPAACVI